MTAGRARRLPPRATELRDAVCARLDDLPLSRHRALLAVVFLSVTFGNLDQALVSFAIPEYAREWGISATLAGLHPVVELGAAMVGAVIWGMLGDRVGRVRTLLLTVILWALGSLWAGLASSFAELVVASALMGSAAGGAVPVGFTLLAEFLPAAHRGRNLVVVGIVAITGSYAIASIATVALVPALGWRSLFLVGVLPSAITAWMVASLPESPRYLCSRGRFLEATRIVERLGRGLTARVVDEARATVQTSAERPGAARDLWSDEYAGRTLGLWSFGLTLGFANLGFLTWLPVTLRELGYSAVEGAAYLTVLSLIATFAAIAAAVLLEAWGTKLRLVWFALLTAATIALFGIVAQGGELPPIVLVPTGGLILFACTSIAGIFTPYATELYGTRLRGTGAGWSAAILRAGGLAGLFVAGGLIDIGAPIIVRMLVLAVPLVVGALVLVRLGVETHKRSLEAIDAS